jgi:hypothetical protein
VSGLSHPDSPDTTGWAMYYTSKGVHKERPALHNLNSQVRIFLPTQMWTMCHSLSDGVSDAVENGSKQ